MAVIRKNRVLIGYEQGTSIKSYKKLFQQTRARFFPLAKPKLSFAKKENTHASVVLPIAKIPADPGDGNYNLIIEDSTGQTLKIRACKEIKATSSLTVSNATGWANSINIKLIDDVGTKTFTCNTGATTASRTSEANYSFGVSGANTTALISKRIFDAINLAYEREELNIKPTYAAGSSVVNLEQVSYGNSGNTNITLNNASGKLAAANSGKFINGTFGIPRQENGSFLSKPGRKFHPKDATAFALYTRGTENSKQLAFDINKIINNSGYSIKSKILQDDVLLVYQVKSGEDGLKYVGRSSPGTSITQLDINDQSKNYNFRFDNSKLMGAPVGENIFYDLAINDSSIPPLKRYVDIGLGTIYSLNYERHVEGFRQGQSITYAGPANHSDMFSGWLGFDQIDLAVDEAPLAPGTPEPIPVEVFRGIFTFPLSQRVIDSDRLDLAPLPMLVKLVIKNNGPGWPEHALSVTSIPESGQTIYQMTVNSYFNSVSLRHPENADAEEQEPTPGPESATRALRTKLLLDRLVLAFDSLSNSIDFIKFELAQADGLAWGGNETYRLRVIENKKLLSADMFFWRQNDDPSQVYIIKCAKGEDSRPIGYQNISADETNRDGERYRNKVKINHFSQYPPLDPDQRSIGSMTILDSSDARWSNSTSFTVSGSVKAVKFTCNTSQAWRAITRVDSNNYTFGIQGRTSGNISTGAGTNSIALSIKDALSFASDRGDLDIYFPEVPNGSRRRNEFGMVNSGRNQISFHLDKIFIRQNDYGFNSNMKIATSDSNSILVEDFTAPSPARYENYLPSFNESTDVFIKEDINHDLEIRSFGLGENIDDISIFRDISFQEPHPDWKASYIGNSRDLILSGNVQYELSGSKFTSLDVSPLYYLSAIDGEFPSGLRNVDSPPGYEFDGVIEPFPLREDILGTNTEFNLRGPKAALMGNYVHDQMRGGSLIVTDKIVFNDSSIFPYHDRLEFLANEFSVGGSEGLVGQSEYRRAQYEVNEFIDSIYSIARPSIIAIDGRSIKPFVDGEEKITTAVALLGNNPNEDTKGSFVSEVFGLNHAHENYSSGEIFKRQSGFDFSSNPHPGTDSIIFGGLIYV